MKNKWLAAFLNLVPGAGYLYVGVRTPFAVLLLLMLPAALIASIDPAISSSDSSSGLSWGVCLILAVPVLAFMVDAYTEANRLNKTATPTTLSFEKEPQVKKTVQHPISDVQTEIQVIGRGFDKRRFTVASYVTTIISTVLGELSIVLNPNYLHSLKLPPGNTGVMLGLGVIVGTTVLMLSTGMFYSLIWLLLDRKAFVRSIGFFDFLLGRWTLLTGFVRILGLLVVVALFAGRVANYQYANMTALIFHVLYTVGFVVSNIMLLDLIVALLQKPRFKATHK